MPQLRRRPFRGAARLLGGGLTRLPARSEAPILARPAFHARGIMGLLDLGGRLHTPLGRESISPLSPA